MYVKEILSIFYKAGHEEKKDLRALVVGPLK